MRSQRTPFFGMPEDRLLLPPEALDREQAFLRDELGAITPELLASMGDGSAPEVPVIINGAEPSSRSKEPHPDYREKGVRLPTARFHEGENRRTRRAAVANWQPPKQPEPSEHLPLAPAMGPEPKMPTRRELWLQRAKHRRGKLDPELRRLQRKALNGK